MGQMICYWHSYEDYAQHDTPLEAFALDGRLMASGTTEWRIALQAQYGTTSSPVNGGQL